MQTIADAEKAGGDAAVAALTIVLCIDSQHTSWVAEQVAAKHHWMLQPDQVIITSIARFPAMMWEVSLGEGRGGEFGGREQCGG